MTATENITAGQLPPDQLEVYEAVLRESKRRGLRFAVGGAFALATYTGAARNTKDLDLYITPDQKAPAIRLLKDLGLHDYYDQLPYDRRWIYRSHAGGNIVDIIWAMANQRTAVDAVWVSAGPETHFGSEAVRVLPPEELLWSKLYVLQKDRCDWPDILNLLYARAGELDWPRLLARLEDDAPLLGAVMKVFAWIAPGAAAGIPSRVWTTLGLSRPASAAPAVQARVELLDSRPWFVPDLKRP
ncbi:MAG: nucleotidyltransferase family protein [Bryobacteraceae bacterium]|nr:nucleotidyltransferase family protein [Bryobacteraceae bacterium]